MKKLKTKRIEADGQAAEVLEVQEGGRYLMVIKTKLIGVDTINQLRDRIKSVTGTQLAILAMGPNDSVEMYEFEEIEE